MFTKWTLLFLEICSHSDHILLCVTILCTEQLNKLGTDVFIWQNVYLCAKWFATLFWGPRRKGLYLAVTSHVIFRKKKHLMCFCVPLLYCIRDMHFHWTVKKNFPPFAVGCAWDSWCRHPFFFSFIQIHHLFDFCLAEWVFLVIEMHKNSFIVYYVCISQRLPCSFRIWIMFIVFYTCTILISRQDASRFEKKKIFSELHLSL